MIDDPLTWADRNKAAVEAYEKARAQRHLVREILCLILTIMGVCIIAGVLL